MFRRIMATALLAGFLGGLAISVVQQFTTTPIILHAEEFEKPAADAAHKHGTLRRGISLAGTAFAHGPDAAATAARGGAAGAARAGG